MQESGARGEYSWRKKLLDKQLDTAVIQLLVGPFELDGSLGEINSVSQVTGTDVGDHDCLNVFGIPDVILRKLKSERFATVRQAIR